jgi:catechol 2,3-dioxygenase-like lactoylglutathione lyase family enzyme
MSSADLARRFLHVNLNTIDIDAAQVFFADCLGLKLQMRTDPEVLNDGEILGLSGKVRSETRFFYDSRGARASCAIEVIDWVDPPTVARDQSDTSMGLAALGFVVADRARVVEAMSDNGFGILSTETDGLITGGPAAMVLGPDGVVIEIGDLCGAATGTVHFAGARIACTDLQASIRFYTAIGFDHLGSRHNDRMCHVGLTEDADSIRLCLTQGTAAATAPAHKAPNQQGLYRCALRVENIQQAIAAAGDGIAVRGPIWCPLPGTPIDGLHIAFMTDPDGVVIEYVERPLSHFSRPTNGRTS